MNDTTFTATVLPKATDALTRPESETFTKAFSDVRTRRSVAVTTFGRQLPLDRLVMAQLLLDTL